MNTLKLNTLGDKVIVRKAADGGGNEGGGSASGGSEWKYYDVSQLIGDDYANTVMLFACVVNTGQYIAGCPMNIQASNKYAKKIGINTRVKVSNIVGEGYILMGELLEIYLPTLTSPMSEITEEEFYTL